MKPRICKQRTKLPVAYWCYQWQIQGFPEVGAPTLQGGPEHTPNFPKNCTKLKEFGPPGARAPRAPLDPPVVTFVSILVQ